MIPTIPYSHYYWVGGPPKLVFIFHCKDSSADLEKAGLLNVSERRQVKHISEIRFVQLFSLEMLRILCMMRIACAGSASA